MSTGICLMPDQISKLKAGIQKSGGAETFLRMKKDVRATFLLDVIGNKQVADFVNVKMELALDTGKRQVIGNTFKQMFSPEIKKIKQNISKERQILLDEKKFLEKELGLIKEKGELTPEQKAERHIKNLQERLDYIQKNKKLPEKGTTREFTKEETEFIVKIHNAKKELGLIKEKMSKLEIIQDKLDNTTDVKIVDRILADYNAGKSDFISGALEKAFNTKLTNTELDTLYHISEELKVLKKKPSDNIFGRPNTEYYEKLEELNKFFDSKKTIETLRTLTGTIPVGSLLLSPKSAFLNNFSNALSSGIETIISRGTKLQVKVENYDLVYDFIGYAQDVYLASGINVSRIADNKEISDGLDFLLPYGSLENMQANTKLQVLVKKWGTFYEKTIFSGRMNKENKSSKASSIRMASLGYSDVTFSAFNFADEVVSIANQMAKEEGVEDVKERSREIAIDIFQAATQTVDYRLMSIKDIEYHGSLLNALQRAKYRSEVAIFQDKNMVNVGILAVRDILNKVIPDLSIGSTVALFVKTPVNVWILKSYRYFGMEAVEHTIRAVHEMYTVKQISPETADKMKKSYMRTGTSWVLGLIVYSLILSAGGDDGDDEPAYSVSYNSATPDLRKIYTQKNIPYNSFRIGKYWFSADYFGGTASVILSLLDKKYNEGKDLSKLAQTGMFFNSALTGWDSLPIIGELYSLANYRTTAKTYQYSEEKIIQDVFGYIANIASRPIKVGILTDIAKIVDSQKRQIDYSGGWTVPVQQIAQTLPFLTKTLEEKYSFIGEKLNQPAAINQVLFGARYGSEKDNVVVDELYRLTRNNENISLGIESKKLYGYGVKSTLEEMDIPFPQRNKIEATINKNIFNAYSSLVIDDSEAYNELSDYSKVQKLNGLVTKAVELGLEEERMLEVYKDFTEMKKRVAKDEKQKKVDGE